MMFDLKIQATQEPTLDSTASSEIHRGLNLVDSPCIFHRTGVLLRQWELGLFNAMRKLEHNADNHARKPNCQSVEEKHHPDGMEQKRQAKSQGKKQRFTADKPGEFPPFRSRHSRGSDPAQAYVAEIIVEMPLDDIQSVEWPQIEMLPAMKFEPLLMRR